MTLHDAYVGTLEAKKHLADEQLKKIVDIYDCYKSGKKSEYVVVPKLRAAVTKQNAALDHFARDVDNAIARQGIDRAADPAAFASAVRKAYGQMIGTFGMERVDPTERGGVAKYDEWFKGYHPSFPIPGERETKADMRKLLSEPMTDKGYGEIAIGLRDPLMGGYAGGVQALMVAEAAAGMFTYAFLDPAYQGLGLGRVLVESTRKSVQTVVEKYNPDDTRAPAVFLEKNKVANMPLENMVLDTTGINVLKLPREGDQLTKGAISQFARDGVWSHLGAKELKDVCYIQPSLDGVTRIKNKKDRVLAIRYLLEDASMSKSERLQASILIKTALDGKAEHCPLALCAFVDGQQTEISAQQTEQFLRAFYQTSCLDTDEEGLKADIFAQATLTKVAQQADANGNIALIDVKPYGGPIPAQSAEEAEKIFQTLLKTIPPDELKQAVVAAKQGLPETTYKTWLEKYEPQVRAKMGLEEKAGVASNPGRGRKSGMKLGM